MKHRQCHIECLFSTKNGSIHQCTQCRKYQVAFGNMLVYYQPADFRIFSEFILNLDLEHPRKYAMIGNRIIVQPAMNTGLCLFTIEELCELQELLQSCACVKHIEQQLQEILS